MVSQNNDGNYYEIAVDTAKEGAEVWSLNDWFKARVGDDGTPLVMRFYTQGQLNSFDGNQKPIIQGNVGAYSFDDQKQIVMAADAKVVSWTGDPSDMLPGGRVRYHFPQQMFPTEGAFYGFVGYVDESNGRRLTGVNVWFRVLGGVAQMGKACDYYINDLDIALANAKEKMRQAGIDFKAATDSALQDLRTKYQQEVQANQDASETTRASLLKLADSVGALQAHVDARNIVFQQDFDRQTQALKNSIADTLSKVKFNAQGFANVDQIKSTYPNGAEGIFIAVDTGHQWYWIDNSWVDAGPFQAEKNPEVEDARTWADGTVSQKIGDAIRGQITREKNERVYADAQEKGNRAFYDVQEKEERKDADRDLVYQIALHETALEKKEVNLVNQNGDALENKGKYPVGKIYLPKTDPTGTQEGVPAESVSTFKAIKSMGPSFEESIRNSSLTLADGNPFKTFFPTLELIDVPDSLTDPQTSKAKGKKIKNIVRIKFGKINEILEGIKIQGSSSSLFPKKNYTLNFNSPVCIQKNWGYRDKYVIKANMQDPTQARNVVNAKIWGEMRKTRVKKEDMLVDATGLTLGLQGEADPTLSLSDINYGAIDGFPVGVYINGKWNGIYNFTIPKDGWMAKMGSKPKNVIVSAGNYSLTNASYFNGLATMRPDSNGRYDFELEYSPNEEDKDWILDSLNQAIQAVMADYQSADDFIRAVSDKIDINSAIDYLIFSSIIDNGDGIGKNYLLQTFDGTKWYMVPYDLDLTAGLGTWTGEKISSPTNNSFDNVCSKNKLFNQIRKLMPEKIKERFLELEGVLDSGKLIKMYGDYINRIPKVAFDYETRIWPQTPGASTQNFNFVAMWFYIHGEQLSKTIDKL